MFQFTRDDKTMKPREREWGREKGKEIGHEFSFCTEEVLDVNPDSITYWLSDLGKLMVSDTVSIFVFKNGTSTLQGCYNE